MGKLLRHVLALLALAALPMEAAAQPDEGTPDGRRTIYVDADAALEATMDHLGAAMMRVELLGDANLDFAIRTIVLQQAIIDLAEMVLDFGSDPELAALAKEIRATQEAQIAPLRAWVAARLTLEE
ncbi:DUF305 domain-containing protein [Pelagibacterium limicola]|uniref:DUF305 domain-containing protein n=1 Tax=Pelagibacterium limicola TaxID=2791022 RepID=UPI0018AFCE3D|nr:DUF305 domain-containing protein [Pelagibacterium limicola]